MSNESEQKISKTEVPCNVCNEKITLKNCYIVYYTNMGLNEHM